MIWCMHTLFWERVPMAFVFPCLLSNFFPCLLSNFFFLTLANMCQWLCQSRRRRRGGGQPCRRLKNKNSKTKSETSAPWWGSTIGAWRLTKKKKILNVSALARSLCKSHYAEYFAEFVPMDVMNEHIFWNVLHITHTHTHTHTHTSHTHTHKHT